MQGRRQGRGLEARWSELMRKPPAFPRPTAEEQEAEVDFQMELLLMKIAELEEQGVGTLHHPPPCPAISSITIDNVAHLHTSKAYVPMMRLGNAS